MKVYPAEQIKNISLLGSSGSGVTTLAAVSYTHLDVYKRQSWLRPPGQGGSMAA